MCIKNESVYRGCFDFLFLDLSDLNSGPTFQDILLQRVGAVVADEGKFQQRIEALLDLLHEEGIIRPATAVEAEAEKLWTMDLEWTGDGLPPRGYYLREIRPEAA